MTTSDQNINQIQASLSSARQRVKDLEAAEKELLGTSKYDTQIQDMLTVGALEPREWWITVRFAGQARVEMNQYTSEPVVMFTTKVVDVQKSLSSIDLPKDIKLCLQAEDAAGSEFRFGLHNDDTDDTTETCMVAVPVVWGAQGKKAEEVSKFVHQLSYGERTLFWTLFNNKKKELEKQKRASGSRRRRKKVSK